MNLLPFEKITLRTALTQDELNKRLNAWVEPKRPIRYALVKTGSVKPYEGEVTENQFRIRRIIDYRNSFLPEISGTIQADRDGSIIQIRMELHPFVLVFLVVWGGIVGMACLAVLPVILNQGNAGLASLIPFGMIVFLYGLTMIAFRVESSRSKKDLSGIFEAKPIDG